MLIRIIGLLILFSLFSFEAHAGLQDSLVAWWKFDGDLRDSSGNNHHGTGTGTAGANSTPQPSTEIPPVQFDNPSSYDFDGTDDGVTIGTDAAFSFGTNPYSISVWLFRKKVQPNLFPRVISKEASGLADWSISIGETGTVFLVRGLGGGGSESVSLTGVAVGEWHHITYVYDGARIYGYLNGAFVRSAPSTRSVGNGSTLRIGRRANVNSEFCNCRIDDLRIYTKALSAEEVAFLADGYDRIPEKTVSLSPQFDQGKSLVGKVFQDLNSNGIQDEGERGIAGVKVASDSGIYAITDEDGQYHFPYIETGQRLLKIDESTLSEGSVVTTGNPLKITVTEGSFVKASFGVIPGADSSAPTSLDDSSGPLLKIFLSQDPLKLSKELSIAHVFEDENALKFTIDCNYRMFVQSAEISLFDSNNQLLKNVFLPQPLPHTYRLDLTQENIDSSQVRHYQLKVHDKDGNTDSTGIAEII